MAAKFTVEDLNGFDGKSRPIIYVALNFNVFDVTEKGKENYGPGGQYSIFAGKDISRAMATMTMTTKDAYDDLSDLSEDQMKSLKTWEVKFLEKYPVVGRLVN